MSNLSLFDEWRKNFNIVKNIKSYQDCVKFNTFEKLILVRDKKFIDREYEVLPYVLDNIVYNSRFIVKDFSDNFNSLSLRNIDSKTQLSLVKTQLKNKRKKAVTKVTALVERMMGIEPTRSAWKAEVLPLNYICILTKL